MDPPASTAAPPALPNGAAHRSNWPLFDLTDATARLAAAAASERSPQSPPPTALGDPALFAAAAEAAALALRADWRVPPAEERESRYDPRARGDNGLADAAPASPAQGEDAGGLAEPPAPERPSAGAGVTAQPSQPAPQVPPRHVRVGGARATNWVGELQNRVARKLGRSVKTGDIEFPVEELTRPRRSAARGGDMDGKKGGRGGKGGSVRPDPKADPIWYRCRIRVPELGDHPEMVGPAQPSKREAKRAAAEAALTDPLVTAFLPPRPQANAPASSCRDAEAVESTEEADIHWQGELPTDSAAASGQGAADSAAAASQTRRQGALQADAAARMNTVGELQEAVQKLMRRSDGWSGVVKYVVRQDKSLRYTATVHVSHAGGTLTFTSSPHVKKRDAKREAAEAAFAGGTLIEVAANGPRGDDDVGPETDGAAGDSREEEKEKEKDKEGDGNWLEPAEKSNLCKLQERLQAHFGRSVAKGDIAISYETVRAGKGPDHFACTVRVDALPGQPAHRGKACANKRQAKDSAVSALLEELEASRALLPKESRPKGVGRRQTQPASEEAVKSEAPEEAVAAEGLRNLEKPAEEPAEGWFTLPPGFARAEEEANPKFNKMSQLNEEVQKALRRLSVADDIKYTVTGNNAVGYTGTVSIPSIEGCPPVSGIACHSKRLARRSAAEAALRDPAVRGALARATARSVRLQQAQAAHPRPPGLDGPEDWAEPDEDEEQGEEEHQEQPGPEAARPEAPPEARQAFKAALSALPPLSRGPWPRLY
ncbi:unnamed protein product [Prorocentrum cordatum]|uniref:DRBM domain-containing protein n=1 Tax=Prorocentrum cordatum TaxID=2364126 RepID=A0ABN9VMQ2_9DINO|nr:unnamed protein product [Polarella glacialis]